MFIKFNVYNPLQNKEQTFELPHSFGVHDFVILAKEELNKYVDKYLQSLDGQCEKYNIAEQMKNKPEWVEALFSSLAKAKNEYSMVGGSNWEKHLENHLVNSFDEFMMSNKNYYSWISVNFTHESVVYEFLNEFAKAASFYDIKKEPLKEMIIAEISSAIEKKAQERDMSGVMEAIPNQFATKCYLINAEANTCENMISFVSNQAPSLEFVVPNNGLRKLLELANISSDEFKKVISSRGLDIFDNKDWNEFNVEKNKNISSCLSVNQLISLIEKSENGGIPVFSGKMFIYDVLKKDIDSAMIFSNGSIGIYDKNTGGEISAPISGKILISENGGQWVTKKMINDMLGIKNDHLELDSLNPENNQLLSFKIKPKDGIEQNKYTMDS